MRHKDMFCGNVPETTTTGGSEIVSAMSCQTGAYVAEARGWRCLELKHAFNELLTCRYCWYSVVPRATKAIEIGLSGAHIRVIDVWTFWVLSLRACLSLSA